MDSRVRVAVAAVSHSEAVGPVINTGFFEKANKSNSNIIPVEFRVKCRGTSLMPVKNKKCNFAGITVPFLDETATKLFVPLCYTEILRCG